MSQVDNEAVLASIGFLSRTVMELREENAALRELSHVPPGVDARALLAMRAQQPVKEPELATPPKQRKPRARKQAAPPAPARADPDPDANPLTNAAALDAAEARHFASVNGAP